PLVVSSKMISVSKDTTSRTPETLPVSLSCRCRLCFPFASSIALPLSSSISYSLYGKGRAVRTLPLLQVPVQGFRLFFFHGFLHRKRGPGRSAVYQHPARIAGLIGHRTSFNQPGYFQKFVQSHNFPPYIKGGDNFLSPHRITYYFSFTRSFKAFPALNFGDFDA